MNGLPNQTRHKQGARVQRGGEEDMSGGRISPHPISQPRGCGCRGFNTTEHASIQYLGVRGERTWIIILELNDIVALGTDLPAAEEKRVNFTLKQPK